MTFTNRDKPSKSRIFGYIFLLLFKTVIGFPFIFAGIFAIISGFGKYDFEYQGGVICVLISPFILYDWIRTLCIPWWVDDSTNFPVWWEGGGL